MRSPKTVGDAVPGQSPKKKPRRAAPSAGAKKPATRAARPRSPRKTTAPNVPAAADPKMPDQGAVERMVAEAAYYLAEKRAFASGFEEQDWQAAREQIEAQLRAARNPLG
jgi:hypothetical protein